MVQRNRWPFTTGTMGHTRHKNNYARWLAVASSATLLAAAFFYPPCCAWLSFLFLMPVFYAALLPLRLGFWHGFVWGLIFFGLHWWGIVLLFIERAEGSLRLIAPLFLMVYGALYAGLWFMVAAAAARVCSTDGGRVVSWTLVTIIYFVIMYRVFFWIFGSCKGYPFALPLLPLAHDPRWLAALPTLSPYGLLACLVIAAAVAASMLVHGLGKIRIFILALAWLPFLYGWLLPLKPETIPSYLALLGYVSPPVVREHPLDCAQAINESLEQLLTTRKRVECVLMPESSYPFPLNESENIIDLWCVNALTNNQKLLIGTHKKQEGNLYNCLSCVTNMQIIHSYVKTELFFFTEYVPFPWNLFPNIRHLFLKNKQGFSRTDSFSGLCELLPGLYCRLAICSELFFAAYPRGSQPLLAVVNDAWFSAAYLRHLMFLFARFSALAQQQELLYISHEQGVWISPRGMVVDL